MTATRGMLSSGPAELPGVRRRRHKLILSYLSQQRLFPTFQSMVQKTDAHMCGDHLRRLVVRGRWVEALDYLSRFNSRKSVASNALHFFLHTIWALAKIADGARDGSVKPSAHQHGMALYTMICRCAKLCSIVKAMLDSPRQCVSLDWELTRTRAANFAYFLAREDPDLYRLMQLPDHGRILPHQVLPISHRGPRRHHVKRPPGRRPPGRGPAIARLYLSKRRSMHSSSPHTPAFMDESLDRVATLVGECLKADKHQKQPGSAPGWFPLSSPGAPALQTNSRTSSVPNAGAPASSQIMSGTFTNQAKNYGVSPAQISGTCRGC
uniref:Uncharacterized protein n=1 Tax=Avena sativa TaxID=4498 RepID=A0ACD5YA82_AVESA